MSLFWSLFKCCIKYVFNEFTGKKEKKKKRKRRQGREKKNFLNLFKFINKIKETMSRVLWKW